METYIEKIKTTLYNLIREMSEHYWLYVSDLERNFSRDRKLPFEKKGWKYLIRIRDTAGIISAFHFKPDCHLDVWKTIPLTRKQTNAFKKMKADDPERYRCLPNSSPFDSIDLHDNKYFDRNVRFVRFRISDDTYQTVITNLPADEFSSADIKHLYNLRWGTETSFREWKYTIGLKQPVSKKAEYISQESCACPSQPEGSRKPKSPRIQWFPL